MVMTPGMAVASFFAGGGLSLAMRVMYELVQRKWGRMRGAQQFLAGVARYLALIVPAIPGLAYVREHEGARFMGVGVFAWEIVAVAASLALGFVCTALFRGGEIMREIERELDGWGDGE